MSRQDIIDYWIEKARDDLASAWDNYSAGRFQNAVRDAYFACFHAFSAVLFKEGKTFKKHKEVRSILHRDFIRTKKIDMPIFLTGMPLQNFLPSGKRPHSRVWRHLVECGIDKGKGIVWFTF